MSTDHNTDNPAPAGTSQTEERARRVPLARRPVVWCLVGAIVLAGGFYGYRWLVHDRFIVSTNDAYLRADLSIIAPAVKGHIQRVLVAENAKVQKGDVLLEIDPGEYRLAVQAEQGRLATKMARIARIGQQIEAQHSEVLRAKAELDAAKAEAERAAADLVRTEILTKRSITSAKLFEDARAADARSRADIRRTEAMVRVAEANVAVLEASRAEAQREAAEIRVALARAERDLAQTRITAPFSGVVGNLRAKPGQYVDAGTRLLALLPLDSMYVEANFKETQLARVVPGQAVTIWVDAVEGRSFQGQVASIAPAAGSEFALLPPDNATGNFTKIVKRVPVRIRLLDEQSQAMRLRAGLSVYVGVDTRDAPKPRPTLLSLLGLEGRADDRRR